MRQRRRWAIPHGAGSTATPGRLAAAYRYKTQQRQHRRNLPFRVPGSSHSSRVSEVDEGAPVNADEGWTERVKHGKNVAPQTCQHLNSVRPDDCSTLWGLERLPADLCRALGRVYTRPSALPDVLLRWPGGQDARVW